MEPTADDAFTFSEEMLYFNGPYHGLTKPNLGSGHNESRLKEEMKGGISKKIATYCYQAISQWKVFHFHDTSDTAGVNRLGTLHDNDYLRSDASNLAAFLYELKKSSPITYKKIVKTVRLAIPFFDDFVLKPQKLPTDEEQIRLLWKQKDSDYALWPSQLSDGSIRFICLVTVLLQPTAPSTIIIDEPELGLHPFAITLLAGLIRSSSNDMQVIVSTQSASLVSEFSIDDLIVVEREGGATVFKRLDKKDFTSWLDDYTVGELWQKNIFGGRPLFTPRNIYLLPSLLGKPGHKGGNVKFDRILNDVKNLLLADTNVFCTTFFDFYGLPKDFPGKAEAMLLTNIEDKYKMIERRLVEKLQCYIGQSAMRRFIPYVQLYEFEGLLFSQPKTIATEIGKNNLESQFQEIRDQFDSPEHINDSSETAPSKRITLLFNRYDKVIYGSLVTLGIGIKKIREECHLFNHWIDRLQKL